jgi:hypothetical protein
MVVQRWPLVVVLVAACSLAAVGVDPESGGLVQRLFAQKAELVQPGLSYTNSSTPLLLPMQLAEIRRLSETSQVLAVAGCSGLLASSPGELCDQCGELDQVAAHKTRVLHQVRQLQAK